MNEAFFLRSVWVVLACLLSLPRGEAIAQTVSQRKLLGRYQQLVWHDQHGLPENTVMKVTQTRDGYLWIGTVEGAARFDGVRFTVFDRNNTPALQHNHVLSLLEDRQGNLWLGTNGGGLTRYRAGQFQHYGAAEGLSDDRVWALAEDRAGDLWVGTEGGGLNRLRDGRFTVWNQHQGLPDDRIWALQSDAEGALWIGTSKGLARFKDERFTVWTSNDGLPANLIWTFTLDRAGALWIGTDGGGIARFSGGHFTVYNTQSGLTSNSVRALLWDREDTLWVGTMGGGLLRWRDHRFTSFSERNGLHSDRISALYQSAEGDLWIGSNGFGVAQLRTGRVSVLTQEDGLVYDFVRPILEDASGALWIGTVEGLSRYQHGVFTNWTVKDGLPHNHLTSLHEDAAGNLWIGTRGGLARFKDGRFTVWTTANGLPENVIRSLTTDRAGNLWIGTYGGGLVRLRDGRFTVFTERNGMPNRTVDTLLVDRAGDLWIGTWGGGLCRYRDGRFTTWTMRDGLVSNHIYALCETADGALWIGTGGSGISRFKQDRFASVTMKDGLYDNTTYNLLVDDYGELWLNGNKGIYHAKLAELNEFCDGRRAAIATHSYGVADGMLRRETCRAYPGSWKTRDGRLWFPTTRGVAVIDPQPRQEQAPRVRLEAIKIAGKLAPHGLPVDAALRIAPGETGLEIEYTGLYWEGPQQVEFRYQMAGLETGWTEAGTRRTAYYSYLPPGQYLFRVIAGNGEGMWDSVGCSLRVIVLPHFYQTWWFRLLLALLLAGGVGLVFKWRLDRANRARRAQEAFSRQLLASQEAERKRIAAELHDSLGQQLLIIKNHALLGLAEHKDVATEESLTVISEMTSQALEEARQIAYNLRPYQIDRFGLTRALQSMLKRIADASEIHFYHEVDSLDGLFAPEAEINLYRIVQESINNILKHSRATAAEIKLVRQGDHLLVRVADNGQGVALPAVGADAEAASSGLPQREGFGLTSMAERARMLGGRYQLQSAPGQGTVIQISIPLPGAR